MKNKIVVWGTNEQNEKVLIALELQADTNKVLLYTFPEAIATEEFVNKMMAEWRNGAEVPFPEGHTTLERELSVTQSLLPDDLRVERGDLIQRAQTEWHFAVLSAKLHKAYEQELADFGEKVRQLSTYDHQLWESLRQFWDKVQGQSRDRNLFREHADNLRDNINTLFDDLKKMRSRVQDEFANTSQKVFDDFNRALDDVETRIAAGGNKLNSVFEDLKQMQRRYRDAKMSNEHRNALWERLDGAFKAAKERKFGPGANEGSLVERHSRRIEGLNDAIRRMEDSIKRDEDELTFQRKKVDATEGQLEAQIRTAKIKMIEERVSSKREKLAEMYHTRAEVDRQINSARDKEAKRAEKDAERQRLEAAKQAAKSEIAASMKGGKGRGEQSGGEKGKKEESMLGAIGTVLGEALEDAITTARAVASVVADNAGEVLEEMSEKAGDVLEKVAEKAGEAYAYASEKIEDLKEKVSKEENPEATQAAPETPVADHTEAEARHVETPDTESTETPVAGIEIAPEAQTAPDAAEETANATSEAPEIPLPIEETPSEVAAEAAQVTAEEPANAIAETAEASESQPGEETEAEVAAEAAQVTAEDTANATAETSEASETPQITEVEVVAEAEQTAHETSETVAVEEGTEAEEEKKA